MTNNQFMCGLVADLWKLGQRRFDPRDLLLHSAMRKTIAEIGDDCLRSVGVDFYVDPIGGTVDDVFHVFSILQGYGLASRSNPTFSKSTIELSEGACSELLDSLSEAEKRVVAKFADLLMQNYPSHQFAH